jgi:hypothetical protein
MHKKIRANSGMQRDAGRCCPVVSQLLAAAGWAPRRQCPGRWRCPAARQGSPASMAALPTRILIADGVEMPAVGLGTFRARGEAVQEAVRAALDCGIRHFDTASVYKARCTAARSRLRRRPAGIGAAPGAGCSCVQGSPHSSRACQRAGSVSYSMAPPVPGPPPRALRPPCPAERGRRRPGPGGQRHPPGAALPDQQGVSVSAGHAGCQAGLRGHAVLAGTRWALLGPLPRALARGRTPGHRVSTKLGAPPRDVGRAGGAVPAGQV